MNQQDQLTLKKLLAKSSRECGLDAIDHRRLTRLIEQADAEEELLITGANPDKVIITSGSGESLSAPRSQIIGGEGTLVKRKCSNCGAETDWDLALGDRPLCVKCWDKEAESEKVGRVSHQRR